MNLDPQAIQAVLAAGNDPQEAALKRQQSLVDKLRQQSMGASPTMNAGNVIVPNWGGMVSAGMAHRKAESMQPGIDAGMQGVAGRQVDARKQYLDALMMGMRRPYPQQSAPMLPPDGMEDQ